MQSISAADLFAFATFVVVLIDLVVKTIQNKKK